MAGAGWGAASASSSWPSSGDVGEPSGGGGDDLRHSSAAGRARMQRIKAEHEAAVRDLKQKMRQGTMTRSQREQLRRATENGLCDELVQLLGMDVGASKLQALEMASAHIVALRRSNESLQAFIAASRAAMAERVATDGTPTPDGSTPSADADGKQAPVAVDDNASAVASASPTAAGGGGAKAAEATASPSAGSAAGGPVAAAHDA
uniref:BHLH domain-containing protein n=1 Tax=Bicosoecida sp. CB-2014 TaxID=1486930 RepID=A0A7S1CN13_9STRA